MKKLGRKLTLSRETIRDLNDSQLREAAGGATAQGGRCRDDGSNVTEMCVTDGQTGCATCGCC